MILTLRASVGDFRRRCDLTAEEQWHEQTIKELMSTITIFHVLFDEIPAFIFIAEASAAKCDFCEFLSSSKLNMQVLNTVYDNTYEMK